MKYYGIAVLSICLALLQTAADIWITNIFIASWQLNKLYVRHLNVSYQLPLFEN